MHRLRFTTASALFEAFPTAVADVGGPVVEQESLAYAAELAGSGNIMGALSFVAYLLPRREAVHWACQSVRSLPGSPDDGETACLEAAERWVRTPDEDLRFAAARTALGAQQTSPATFAAYGAGYAGRTLAPPDLGPAPAAPHLTARSVSCVFLLAGLRVAQDRQTAWRRTALEAGVRLAT
jgi:hypothetical protein